MDGHRTCSGVSVVLSEERVVCRAEESLSAACRNASHKDEHHNSAGQTCEHRSHAPEEDGDGGHPLAAETVACHSSERNHTRIAEVEDGGDQTHRGVCKVEGIADCREHGVEHLTVRLVEQICHPEKRQNLPFVMLVSAFHSAENVLFKLCVV